MNPSDSESSSPNTVEGAELSPGGSPSPSETPASVMAAEVANLHQSDVVEWLEVPESHGPTESLRTPTDADEWAPGLQEIPPELHALLDFLICHPNGDCPAEVILQIDETHVTMINQTNGDWQEWELEIIRRAMAARTDLEDFLAGAPVPHGQEQGTHLNNLIVEFVTAWQSIIDQRFRPPQVDCQSILDTLNNTTVGALGATGYPNDALECSICLEHYLPEQVLVVLPCHTSHHFHRNCLEDWLTNHSTCPLCRNSL